MPSIPTSAILCYLAYNHFSINEAGRRCGETWYFYCVHQLGDLVQQQTPAQSPFVTCTKVLLFLFLSEEEQSELCCDSKTAKF